MICLRLREDFCLWLYGRACVHIFVLAYSRTIFNWDWRDESDAGRLILAATEPLESEIVFKWLLVHLWFCPARFSAWTVAIKRQESLVKERWRGGNSSWGINVSTFEFISVSIRRYASGKNTPFRIKWYALSFACLPLIFCLSPESFQVW